MTTTSTELDPSTIVSLRARAFGDLFFFAKGVLGFDWLDKDIHGPICDLLEDPQNTRLRIVLPRSWLKSTLVSIAYPIWRACKDPDIRILIVQNSDTNACKKLAVIRGKFEQCAVFRAVFPEMLPTKDCIWSSNALQVPRKTQNAEATFEAAGTRTRVVSRHYNIVIEDDTVAPDLDDVNAEGCLPTSEDVEQAIGWHRMVGPLLVNMVSDQNIIVGTRWFERDLISWNQETEKNFKGYERAVKETNGLADEDGVVTYPSRFPQSVLDQLLAALGKYLYSCLYMNKPLRSKDMVFQPEWFRYYDHPTRDLLCYTTVDLAGDPAESKGEPDYNVVLTTGKDLVSGRIFVLDYFRAKCNQSEVIQAIFDHVRRFSPVVVGIEAIQYQQVMIGAVRERMRAENLWFTVEGVTHGKKSKNFRIQGLQPFFQNGQILLRRHHRELEGELLAFPLSRYDDVGDALSMQIPMWALTKSRVEERADEALRDPFSFDYARAELYEKGRARHRAAVAWASNN